MVSIKDFDSVQKYWIKLGLSGCINELKSLQEIYDKGEPKPEPKKIIVSNKIRCKSCGDVIESTHVYDSKRCSCKSVGVDGGTEYLRRIGSLENIEELSEYREEN